MSHHFGKFFGSRNDYSNDERLRQFIRRNRKKILIFFGVVVVIGVGFLGLIGYFGLQLIQKAPKLISGSGDVVAQNQGTISQIIQWGLSMFRQWGFLFNG